MKLRFDTDPQVDFAFSEENIRHKLSTCNGVICSQLSASLLRRGTGKLSSGSLWT